MKKYLFGIFAIALAIGFSAFTNVRKVESKGIQTTYDWYAVNPSTGLVTSETPIYNDFTEAEVIAQDDCQDETGGICLAGSNSPLLVDEDVTGFPDGRKVIEHFTK